MQTTLTLTLPRLHSAQRRIANEARRYSVVCCGRRFGKSLLAIDRLVPPALEGYPVAYFAPTYKMLSETWRETSRLLRPVTARTNAQEHRLELITGGVVDMWSLDVPDVARGRKYRRVAIDEAAMVRGLLEAWQQVIRPTLADFEGDAWFLSTPKGMTDFYTLYLWGQDAERPEWASWQMPTAANPHIRAAEIETMRQELPAVVFDQEVLAQFVADDGAVFRPADIDAAEDGAIGDQPFQFGRSYVMSVDVGRRQDATVINVTRNDEEPYQRVYHERLERVSYPLIQQRIAAVARLYQCTPVVESNGIGDPVIENLDVPAEPFITTARSKLQALQSLQLLLEHRRYKVRWTAQERKELTGYAWDDRALTQDCVMSLAITAHALADALGTLEYAASPLAGWRG